MANQAEWKSVELRPEKGAAVVYLPFADVHAQEDDVERIDPYSFYDIGKALKPMGTEGELRKIDVFWTLMPARTAITQLVDGNPLPLGISRAKAVALQAQLTDLWDREFTEVGAEGKTMIKFPESDAKFAEWATWGIRKALTEFETVFAEEMRETATYFVPRRGIFSTPALVDSADDTFPTELMPVIPQKTRDDWKSAGRCLAFNLLSASGFHVARAVEGMVEAYYQMFCGVAGATANTWQVYITELEKIAKTKPTPCPSKKVIGELLQMKDDYRNPIVHPRVVLTEPDARMLFANGESLIIAMAQEIVAGRAVQGGVQLALTPATPPALSATTP